MNSYAAKAAASDRCTVTVTRSCWACTRPTDSERWAFTLASGHHGRLRQKYDYGHRRCRACVPYRWPPRYGAGGWAVSYLDKSLAQQDLVAW